MAARPSGDEEKSGSLTDLTAKLRKRAIWGHGEQVPNSTAPECKEDKGQLIKLRQKLRDTEEQLESDSNRIIITRLEGKEDLQKKAYNDLKQKK